MQGLGSGFSWFFGRKSNSAVVDALAVVSRQLLCSEFFPEHLLSC